MGSSHWCHFSMSCDKSAKKNGSIIVRTYWYLMVINTHTHTYIYFFNGAYIYIYSLRTLLDDPATLKSWNVGSLPSLDRQNPMLHPISMEILPPHGEATQCYITPAGNQTRQLKIYIYISIFNGSLNGKMTETHV